MSNTEPRPTGDALAAIRGRLAAAKPTGPVSYPYLDETEEAEMERMRAEARIARWERVIPLRFRDSDLSDFAGKVLADLVDWRTVLKAGANLVIFGPVGVGKTRAACAAVREACEQGFGARFQPAGEMFDSLRPGGSDDAFDQLVAVGVLIVDDLGSEKVTDWTAERFDVVMNRRWLDQKPTVVTTNLDAETLAVHIGERAYSRLVGDAVNDAVVLRLTGQDRRRHPDAS